MEFVDARKYKKQVKELYKTAFPREERYPTPFLFHKADNVNNCFYAVLDQGEFVGLVYTINAPKMVFIFYLAVVESMRGKGYGSKILAEVKKLYPTKTITLTIEDTAHKDAPNYNQRIRRLKFYETNGYKQLFIKIREAGVEFEVLGTEGTITRDEFITMMRNYLGKIVSWLVYRGDFQND